MALAFFPVSRSVYLGCLRIRYAPTGLMVPILDTTQLLDGCARIARQWSRSGSHTKASADQNATTAAPTTLKPTNTSTTPGIGSTRMSTSRTGRLKKIRWRCLVLSVADSTMFHIRIMQNTCRSISADSANHCGIAMSRLRSLESRLVAKTMSAII
jgi:hypothetical protein